MPHTLLLADDSVTIQRVIELTFADEDVQVVAVGDGREAIARISAEPPDIVLADIGMPEQRWLRGRGIRQADAAARAHPGAAAHRRVRAGRRGARARGRVRRRPRQAVRAAAGDRARARAAGRCRQGASIGAGRRRRGRRHAIGLGRRHPARRPPAIDDYLDRLDAAFAAMSASPRPIGAAPSPSDNGGIGEPRGPDGATQSEAPIRRPAVRLSPTGSRGPLPGAVAPRQGRRLRRRCPTRSSRCSRRSRGGRCRRPGAAAVRAVRRADRSRSPAASIARLGDEPMRQAVLDAAERLVREEIDRIKGRQHKAAGGA